MSKKVLAASHRGGGGGSQQTPSLPKAKSCESYLSKHHQDILATLKAAHDDEMKAVSVTEFIETWHKTQKEILFLNDRIKQAEAEHQLLLLPVAGKAHWGTGALAEKAHRLKVEAMKKLFADLKAANDINKKLLLKSIMKGILRRWRCRAMALSAAEWPRSWRIPSLEG